MLNFKNISLRRSHLLLFSGASFTIHKGQKVGVTGANGVGKSSLFAMIRNELHTDEGDFTLPPGLQVAHVAQETPASSQTAIDYVLDGDTELRHLQKQLHIAEQQNDGNQLAQIHTKLDDIGGYTAQSRASRLLQGLGFSSLQQQKTVAEFSGGWRMRLNLAQALMCRSDILLLDEPTNHLDLDAVFWLQDWLEKYPGTLLLISHDRDFLDAITTHILHIEQNQAVIYSGNYSAFERIRAEKLAQQQSAYLKQQQEIAHMQSFVDRFKAKATKARQAQSRVKALQKMTLISQAHVDSPFDFQFAKPEKIPNPLLRVEKVDIGYNGKALLRDVNLSITPGDRIGLLGANGAGKSTLIKFLVGELAAIKGDRNAAEMLQIGYFAQHQLEQLNDDESPLQHLQRLDKQATQRDLRNFLGGFNFHGDKTLQPVAPFSGGEKARLVLALLVYQKPNFLLLDEPTNHLDLEMRHALSVALQDYQGAVVVVSHDRHLLSAVTDQLLLVADGAVQAYEGDLDDYRKWLTEQKNANKEVTVPASNSHTKKQQRQFEAASRKKFKPLRDAVTNEEKQVDKLHKQQHMLEQQLADPVIYEAGEKERLKVLLREKSEVDEALEQAELNWMHALEQLETAMQSESE